MTEESRWVTIQEIRKMIPGQSGRPLSRATILRWITVGTKGRRLPAIKPSGKYWLILRADLEKFLGCMGYQEAVR